jgi:5-methylcytosine-specific restriction endonuclease McrA
VTQPKASAKALLDSFTSCTRSDEVEYKRAMRRDPCAYCGKPSSSTDHIQPTANEGKNEWTNMTGACHSCNISKWTMPLLLFLGYRITKNEFEPWRQASADWRREYVGQGKFEA